MAMEAFKILTDRPEIPTVVVMCDVGFRIYVDVRGITLYDHQKATVQRLTNQYIGAKFDDGIVARLKYDIESYMRTLALSGVIALDPFDNRWKQCYDEEDLL